MSGSTPASPTIISEKKRPIDNEVPELNTVPRMPEAAPRSWAGTELMMADVFGAVNRPLPIPLASRMSAKTQ